jgi:hypothetical protein
MKHGVTFLILAALAILGPATALCSLSCAAKAEQSAAGASSNACPGHAHHSTPHGGTKNCGGHTGSSVVATAPVQNVATGNATIISIAAVFTAQTHNLFADSFSFKSDFPSAKNSHPRSSPPTLRI